MSQRMGGYAAIATVLVALALAGCTAMDKNLVRMEEQVTPITVGDAGAVPAYVLASAMLRAGFTEDQILTKGVAIRDALATSGGAQVRDSDIVLALFSVHDDMLYVTSRTSGTFQIPLA